MENGRCNNYDLLRIISCIAIIAIHVSTMYENAVANGLITENIYVIVAYYTLSRFAVPCFVMLAGAFALSNDKNASYLQYYRKTFAHLGIPTIIFSIFYFLYRILGWGKDSIFAGNADYTILLETVKSFYRGAPFYHMWYMYMMIVLYCLVPVIIRIKKDISKKTFCKIAVVVMIVCVLNSGGAFLSIQWGIKSFAYLGYFLLGFVIKEKFQNRKNNVYGICMITLGFSIEILVSFLQYQSELKHMAGPAENPLNIFIVVASALIFIGFSMLEIGINCAGFASKTFLIYLFHAGVWDIVRGGVWYIDPAYSYIAIPVSVAGVLVVAYGFSVVYEKVWKWLNNQFLITEKICNWVWG